MTAISVCKSREDQWCIGLACKLLDLMRPHTLQVISEQGVLHWTQRSAAEHAAMYYTCTSLPVEYMQHKTSGQCNSVLRVDGQ